MRIAALLSASAAVLALAGQAAIETVADDYDRPRSAPPPPAPETPTVEASLRVRMARMERERRDRKRAENFAKARAGSIPVDRP